MIVLLRVRFLAFAAFDRALAAIANLRRAASCFALGALLLRRFLVAAFRVTRFLLALFFIAFHNNFLTITIPATTATAPNSAASV